MDEREYLFQLILWLDYTTAALYGKIPEDAYETLRRKHHQNIDWIYTHKLGEEYYDFFFSEINKRIPPQPEEVAK